MAVGVQGYNLSLDVILKKKDNIVTVVIVLVFLMMANVIYKKQLVKYDKLKQEISSEQEKAKSLEHIVSLNEKIKKLKKSSWDVADKNLILDKIFNLALETHIKIRGITPGEKKIEKEYAIIPLSLNCEAVFNDLLKFTKKIETYSKLIIITQVSVRPASSSQGHTIMLLASISIEAICMK